MRNSKQYIKRYALSFTTLAKLKLTCHISIRGAQKQPFTDVFQNGILKNSEAATGGVL